LKFPGCSLFLPVKETFFPAYETFSNIELLLLPSLNFGFFLQKFALSGIYALLLFA